MTSSPPVPGLQEAETLIRQASHVLLGLDYDGTLTPIVDEPANALLSASMKQTIWALISRDDVTVTVVSGRAQADLQQLVGIPEIIYAGNHGLEISGPGMSFIEPFAKSVSQELHLIAQTIGRKLHHIPGVIVEDKGLTLSVHHRRVAAVDAEGVRATVHGALKEHADRFHAIRGNKVYEVRPLNVWNKTDAVKWIKTKINQPNALVVYISDNSTKEEGLETSCCPEVTIRAGRDDAVKARILLPDSSAVQEFLRWVEYLRGEASEHAEAEHFNDSRE